MATPDSSPLDEPPYRSCEEIKRGVIGSRQHVRFSDATKRLFWSLKDPFPAAISVMKHPRGANDLEPYFQPDSNPTWHDIWQLPLTVPKVSSIEASVSDLKKWESDWMEWHDEGGHDSREYCTSGDLHDVVRPFADIAKAMETGDWEDDSETEYLIRCCGEDRPCRSHWFKVKLLVTPSEGHDFVTIHDYFSAVHPWLLSLREDIMRMNTIEYSKKLVAEMGWMVDTLSGPELTIKDKKDWVRNHSPRQPRSAHEQRIIDRIMADARKKKLAPRTVVDVQDVPI